MRLRLWCVIVSMFAAIAFGSAGTGSVGGHVVGEDAEGFLVLFLYGVSECGGKMWRERREKTEKRGKKKGKRGKRRKKKRKRREKKGKKGKKKGK